MNFRKFCARGICFAVLIHAKHLLCGDASDASQLLPSIRADLLTKGCNSQNSMTLSNTQSKIASRLSLSHSLSLHATHQVIHAVLRMKGGGSKRSRRIEAPILRLPSNRVRRKLGEDSDL